MSSNALRITAMALALFLFAGRTVRGAEPADGWKQLFNGKDLTGWETWLGQPYKEKEPVGLDKDPKKVYSIVEVDGKPAIRISGEIWGALTSKEEFENYHLRLEFKWGEKKWPPRDNTVRDSGLLYHCVGPHGAAGSNWMQSIECQIQEHDCGDFWSVAGAIVDVEGLRTGEKELTFKKGGEKFTCGGKGRPNRIIKSADFEKKTGEWNTIEVMTVGPDSYHLVNGKVNLVLTNARRLVEGKETPLTRGKIQLQSEGAEIFYRNIEIKPLKKLPDGTVPSP